MVGQDIEPEFIFLTKTPRRGKAVNNRAVAALGRTFKAIQHLNCRHRVTVGVVCMRLQPKPRIGKVGRVDFGTHLELATVIGLANIAEEINDLHQRPILDRASGHMHEPVFHKRAEPVAKLCLVGNQIVKAGRRQLGIQPAVPAAYFSRDPPTI